ncbi:hypothetical protein GCM10025858_17860 [Alicyclobacillus sacchari]|nr:hypothetical protein GCM10025858_17860 [Alicyclobacillus sacchari]
METKGATPQTLANLMVGREVVLRVEKSDAHPGEPILQVHDLHVRDFGRMERVKGVNLELRRGEILGLAGIDGNGQFELADAIAGLLKPEQGQIIFDGDDITRWSPAERTERGIAYVPQDRQLDGLVLSFNLVENTILRDFRKRPFAKNGVIDRTAATNYTERLIREFDVRPPDASRKASELSGEISRRSSLLAKCRAIRSC